jgi:hypothetical protein
VLKTGADGDVGAQMLDSSHANHSVLLFTRPDLGWQHTIGVSLSFELTD